jgi:hypothetical protein
MLDGYLESQLTQLDSISKPMITQTWSIYIDEHYRTVAAPLANGTSTPGNGRRAGPSDGQILMTRGVWERLGSFRPWWFHADTEFMQRAIWCGVPRKTIPQFLYLRRVHPNSLTQSRATGYQSGPRSFYAKQITQAVRRYALGTRPEFVWPAIAVCLPVGQTK